MREETLAAAEERRLKRGTEVGVGVVRGVVPRDRLREVSAAGLRRLMMSEQSNAGGGTGKLDTCVFVRAAGGSEERIERMLGTGCAGLEQFTHHDLP